MSLSYRYAPPRTGGFAPAILPPKAPHTRRPYEIDLAALLLVLGQTGFSSAAVDAETPLVVDAASAASPMVRFHLGGGAPGNPAKAVCIALFFADGTREDVMLVQPVQAASPDIADGTATVPPFDDNRISVGGVQITVAGIPIAI